MTPNLPTATTTAAPIFANVPFRDTEILAARLGEQVHVPMKPFCTTVGLPWEPQRKRIARDPVLSAGASMMEVPSAGGVQQQMTLPLELLVGFLFTADSRRYAPELRDRVDLFRRECFAALHAHFFRQSAPTPVVARGSQWQELEAARRSAPALITLISAETRPAARKYLYELLVHDAERLGLTPPALDQLGDERTPDDLISDLIAGLETLTALRVSWNHFGRRSNGRLAIMLPELKRLFDRYDVDVAIDDEMYAALRKSTARYRVTRQLVASAIQRGHVRAHVIAPWPVGGSTDA